MAAWNIIDPDLLQQVDLFESLERDEVERLAELVYTERFRAGDLIIAEGTPGDRLFLLIEGEARVSKSIPGLGEEALAMIPAGSYFGEMALFGDQRRSADVYADRRCVIYVIELDEFRAFLDENPQTAIKFLWSCARTMSNRVRQANAKVTFLSAAGRFER